MHYQNIVKPCSLPCLRETQRFSYLLIWLLLGSISWYFGKTMCDKTQLISLPCFPPFYCWCIFWWCFWLICSWVKMLISFREILVKLRLLQLRMQRLAAIQACALFSPTWQEWWVFHISFNIDFSLVSVFCCCFALVSCMFLHLPYQAKSVKDFEVLHLVGDKFPISLIDALASLKSILWLTEWLSH